MFPVSLSIEGAGIFLYPSSTHSHHSVPSEIPMQMIGEVNQSFFGDLLPYLKGSAGTPVDKFFFFGNYKDVSRGCWNVAHWPVRSMA